MEFDPLDLKLLDARLRAKETYDAEELTPAQIQKANLRTIKRAERLFGDSQMVSSRRKRYTNQEKQEILVFRRDHTLAETSKKYGVSATSLMKWSPGHSKFKSSSPHKSKGANPIETAITALEAAISALKAVKSTSLADLLS